MKIVTASELIDRFDGFLDLAEGGEEIVVTRNGKEIARLVPPRPRQNVREVEAAFQRLRQRARDEKHGAFDWEEWKAYRDEGRR